VPSDLTASQRLDLGISVLQFIGDRTRRGQNVYGRSWSGKAGRYTEGYAKRKGVSQSGPVDLALTDEMLGKMQYFPSLSGKGEIVIGFKDGTKAQRKAEGNILGSYGRSPDPGKARPFLDILKKDLNALIEGIT
jgi:hypothetical protein